MNASTFSKPYAGFKHLYGGILIERYIVNDKLDSFLELCKISHDK